MNRLVPLITLALLLPAAQAAEQTSTEQDQTALAVTIYNDDLALVKDSRRVRLAAGEMRLDWRDVSARIQPETALLRTDSVKPLTLLEQNFDFDLLTPRKLLEKSVGKVVRVIKTNPATGAETTETAMVLATNDGVVLRYADRVETGVPGRIAFDAVPSTLRDKPTLSVQFRSGGSGDTGLELAYLTGGLGWRADYVAELGAKEDSLDLSGWVTLTNVSGASYRDARLQLVAGDVHRMRPDRRAVPMAKGMVMAETAMDMQEEALFEYHLYTLERPVSILDQQTKQVALLSASQVPVGKEYVLQGADWYYRGQHGELGTKLKPAVYIGFDNQGGGPGKSEGLGVPLPKGIVRVYKKDAAGRAQFVGEDRIDHTAKGERVRLRLGEAFDVTAEKKQTDYAKIASRPTVVETAYQMEIRNAKKEKVTVKVIEPMPGDWEVVSASLPHKKETAHTAVWEVPVPGEGKTVLTWRVRTRF